MLCALLHIATSKHNILTSPLIMSSTNSWMIDPQGFIYKTFFDLYRSTLKVIEHCIHWWIGVFWMAHWSTLLFLCWQPRTPFTLYNIRVLVNISCLDVSIWIRAQNKFVYAINAFIIDMHNIWLLFIHLWDITWMHL